MNLDPELGRTDRIANVLIGAGFIAYAFLGSFERTLAQVVVVGLGLVFVVGGFGGT